MSRKYPPEFEVKLEEFTRTGEAVGRFNTRLVYVYGGIPGETVLVKPLKKVRGGVKAQILEIKKKSSHRIKSKEDHYLSCSPWQIMREEYQLSVKKDLVKNIFKKESGFLPRPNPEVVASIESWNYRNKMEFSFTIQDEKLLLAFHQRFRYYQYLPLTGCVLAHKQINKCAQDILKQLTKKRIKLEQLKNLVLRYSYKEDKCLAVLYVVDEELKTFNLEMNSLAGWMIIYSNPLSPTTITTKILHTEGRDYLHEEISGVSLKYFYNSFFQINPPAFNEIIEYLKLHTKKGKTLVDLYSGVGTIGFTLAGNFEKVISAEFDDRAVSAAKENLKANNLKNAELYSGAAEKQDLDKIISAADTLIVDPPRSGMHPKVTKKIIANAPKHFIYVSCNPHTQAQDMKKLKIAYKSVAWKVFDLYPQTPHMESVIVMKRRCTLMRKIKEILNK